ncbi:hypothetical protein [Nostoc sp.]|uniref:hypothetical protein n=1 Tax=Nostoc sp. TaxID=1180 RepID=UPI002FF4CADA
MLFALGVIAFGASKAIAFLLGSKHWTKVSLSAEGDRFGGKLPFRTRMSFTSVFEKLTW